MFELSIKSSKDIKKLHIDFADGTSSVTECTSGEDQGQQSSEGINQQVNESNVNRPSLKGILEYENGDRVIPDDDYSQYISESDTDYSGEITKPNTDITDREVNVASELQNLDI